MNQSKIDDAQDSNVTCARCNIPYKELGPVSLVEGDLSGTKLATSTLAYLRVEALVCPKCGRVELYL